MKVTTARAIAPLAALSTLLVAPALAEERFINVTPGAEPDSFVVEVEADGTPKLWLDGEPVTAAFASSGNNRYRAAVSDVPTDANRLSVGGNQPAVSIPIRAATSEQAPFNDRVVYHIMLGYFANGANANDKAGMRRWTHRRYAGGDLQGILSKADYLGSLGITDVWLSPVFQSETSHGYDVQDYYRIGDSRAVPGDRDASLALFQQVIKALGDQDVGVILDLPLDYGAGSYDRRAGDPNRRKPKSTKAKQEAEKVWESWGTGFKYWNFSDEDTRLFLIEVAQHWLTEGVSGYRLDYVRGVDHAFWAELYAALKAEGPEVFVFGEAWQDAHGPGRNMTDIAEYYAPVPDIGPQFDSLIEFPMKIVMTDVFARGEDARQLEQWLQATEQAYGGHGNPIYFLDSHDMSRFTDWAIDQGPERLLAAVTFMATLRGPMILFYGTETGLFGSQAQPGFTDSSRIPMPWEDLNQDLIARMTEVIAMKREHPVLQRGARLPLYADDEIVIMARQDETHQALVAANTGSGPRTIEFDFPVTEDAGFTPVVGPGPSAVAGRWHWEIPPLTVAVAIRAR